MRIGSAILVGTAIAFGCAQHHAIADKNYVAPKAVKSCKTVSDSVPSPNKVQQQLIDDVRNLINSAEKKGVKFPPEDVFKLFGWLLKHNPNVVEDEQLKKILEDVDKQVEQYKSQGLNFEDEFGKIKSSLPKSRTNLGENMSKQSEGTKLHAGELTRVLRIYLKATNLAQQLSKSDNPKDVMSPDEAVDFIAFVFLSDADASKVKHYIQTVIDKKLESGHPHKKRIEHYAQKLTDYIDEYVSNRSNAN